MSGAPQAQGLYDPAHEHDACGVGFVADIGGNRSHAIVRDALTLLDHLSHRSAVGCDPCTGDGAGILLQLPHAFLRRAAGEAGVRLPDEEGAYGVGMVFLPPAPGERRACEQVVERVAADERLALLGWRDVPTDPAEIGELARRSVPVVRQLFVARPDGADADAFERKLYVLRRGIERATRQAGVPCYLPSLSARTVVYKGLLRPDQLPRFYADLAESDVVSALALVHSRFSTNTFPTWPLAHPFRFICHNGEINTLRGNMNWMRVRESRMASPLFGDDLPKLFPVIGAGQSDSACFDNAVELLVMGGRSLAHAMAMLIPEAWEGHQAMDADRKAFYEYHAGLMEPWDGPAGLAFTDGRQIGATLDRNGLRPARYAVTGDRVVLASEAGALPLPPEEVRLKGRLQPGRMLLVDTVEGRIVDDEEIKAGLATRRPYRRWLSERRVLLPAAAPPAGPALGDGELSAGAAGQRTVPLETWQRAFGYTVEELKMLLSPMAETGEEPVGSMGNDTPLAVLSERPQLLYKYFKQLFAQVTNPAIDPIREQLVMSLGVRLGPESNLLDETPAHAAQLRLAHPLLTAPELARVRAAADGAFGLATLPTLFPVSGGPAVLETALDVLCREAASAVRAGAGVLMLSDRGVGARWAAIPSLLATAAVHHHLLREGLRARCGIMVETGDAREVAHVALLVGYGAAAVHPYVALETVADLARTGVVPGAPDEAVTKYVKAVGKGLLKILSKMGISTVQSYCGAQVFEAVGLDAGVVARHFAGTSSRIGGAGLAVIAEEALRRHEAAYGRTAKQEPDFGGEYHVRAQGEHHGWNSQTIATLQHATRRGSYQSFKQFSKLVDADAAAGRTLRGLLDFAPANEPVPIDEVEPASEIVKRFATGAMSFGSISREAHETLALAMNQLGGRSNTGEGGEDPARYGGPRNSAIKQVASARFGVTTEYLVHARELQIKIAQGAKPGEGGQLPGHKVDEVIARTRHSTPGVTLISPPPHHDIYSIEDLAQLIYDLKNVNPRATVSVKLVAEAGVGTVAAGVAKAHADLIVISGDSGGTGASPLSSIKHAGIPWELGLAETQQTLVLNGLRSRVRLQTDGQLKTGRDVVVAALLGAEEFGFATAPLIVEGCIMMRKCHLNTCPVGIATQDPELRAKFTGQPEHVVNYFFYVAEEVREIMARLGVRRLDDMVGRVEWLRARVPAEHWKARTLDLSAMLHEPPAEPASGMGDGGRHCTTTQDHGLAAALDHELLRLATPALERGEPVAIGLPVGNVHRTVGAMLSGEIAKRYGQAGLPDGTIEVSLVGSAGQSFGAFAARGLTLTLEGEANDYVGKGLSGGRLVVYPPAGGSFPVEDSIIVGNTVLYGATSGEAYFRGSAGERFAVRNSGAMAVVEGVGDHGCEYMTGGVVVVLGHTGRNFAAGMSGGVAYVLDTEAADFASRCNTALVELGPVRDGGDASLLRDLVERHARFTGSARARALLDSWEESLPRFVRVMPMEYQRALQEQARRSAAISAADVPQIRYA